MPLNHTQAHLVVAGGQFLIPNLDMHFTKVTTTCCGCLVCIHGRFGPLMVGRGFNLVGIQLLGVFGVPTHTPKHYIW